MDLVDTGEKEGGVIADDEEKWLAERSRILGKGTFLRWKRSRHRASTLLVTKETYENMEETNSLSISLGQTLERNTKIS